jgi:DNA end-binding protein Ku
MAKKRRASGRKWRASWKGEVQLGLVRFTVEAINAHSRSGSDIHFHQLHDQCHSRIEHHKVCPIHGDVDNEEIVLGYEYGRDKYVEVDPEELDSLRSREERALTVDEVIAADQLDPIYYDGRMYYLAPVEAQDREPYQLFQRALEREELIALGQVVFSGKQQLVSVRSREGVLVMAMLNYAAEIRDAKALAIDHRVKSAATNLRMARQLIKSLESAKPNIARYEDTYRARVKELLAAKRKGKDLAPPQEEDDEPVLDFISALKKSLKKSSKRPKRKTAARPFSLAGALLSSY